MCYNINVSNNKIYFTYNNRNCGTGFVLDINSLNKDQLYNINRCIEDAIWRKICQKQVF